MGRIITWNHVKKTHPDLVKNALRPHQTFRTIPPQHDDPDYTAVTFLSSGNAE